MGGSKEKTGGKEEGLVGKKRNEIVIFCSEGKGKDQGPKDTRTIDRALRHSFDKQK